MLSGLDALSMEESIMKFIYLSIVLMLSGLDALSMEESIMKALKGISALPILSVTISKDKLTSMSR